jgi:acyl carrier protein
MSPEPSVDVLRKYIESRFGKAVAADEPIIGSVVDSLGVMDLVEFVETTFTVRLPDIELTTENLKSVNAIAGLIGRLKQAA